MTRTTTPGLVLLGALLALPAAGRAETDDADFLRNAASASMLEVLLGSHAAQHAVDPAVRQFGERTMRDHERANGQLESLAQELGVRVPETLEPAQRQLLADLTLLEGADFDRGYMDAMVREHEQDVQAFRQQAEGDSPVDRWAARALPTLEEHLVLAREVQVQARGAATPPAVEHTSTP
jgi:putative membrane protein